MKNRWSCLCCLLVFGGSGVKKAQVGSARRAQTQLLINTTFSHCWYSLCDFLLDLSQIIALPCHWVTQGRSNHFFVTMWWDQGSRFNLADFSRTISSYHTTVWACSWLFLAVQIFTQHTVVYFLQAGALFGSEKAKFEPILAILGYFVANLCTFGALFTGLNSAVVRNICKYQVWRTLMSVTPLAMFIQLDISFCIRNSPQPISAPCLK